VTVIDVGPWHVVAAVVVGVMILSAYRWVYTRSRPVAVLMASGIVVRALIGVTLFWISYLDLPFLRSLHFGDGFWAVAPDARRYYLQASLGYFGGLSAIPDDASARVFVSTLSAWMRLVGLSPASALYLHVGLYAVLSALVVKVCGPAQTWRAALPCIVCLAPISLSPVLLIHGSQPLADEIFVFLAAVTCLTVLVLLRVPSGKSWRSDLPMVVMSLAALGIAMFGLADIRFYFALIGLACLILSTVFYLWTAKRTSLTKALAIGIATLTVASVSYSAGRGQSAASDVGRIVNKRPAVKAPAAEDGQPGAIAEISRRIRRIGRQAAVVWNSLALRVRDARGGFSRRGGQTNLATESDADPTLIEAGLVGLAVTFVPISLVKAMAWADFEGGRGLLLITDIDTVFLDLSLLAALILLVRRRRSIDHNVPYLCFVLGLALLTTGLLAYVVTNFGTLFRLRLLMAVPFWMSVLALSQPFQKSHHSTLKLT
jgi:hypothetical protein